MTELVHRLVGYPHWAGENVVRKLTGSFLPSIPDIVKLLDEEVRVTRYAKEFEEKASNAARLTGPPPARRPTYEELKAKHGPNWGINPNPEPKQLSTAEEEERARKYSEYAAQNAKLPAPTVSNPDAWKLTGMDRVLDPKQQNRRPPTREEARAKLIAEFGQAAFDAVRDQPEEFARLHYDAPKADQGPSDPPPAGNAPASPAAPYRANPDDPLEERWT